MSFFPKSRSRIRRESSDWVVRLAGQPSAEDHAGFRRWRDADRRHAEAYDRIAAIWNQSGRLSPSTAETAVRSDTPLERPRAFRLALAASLAAAVLLVSAVLIGQRWLPGAAPQQAAMQFAAGAGEIREVGLPDGSRLILDSGSRVDAAFSAAARTLTLRQGRARFAVAHETRPFIVRAGASEVVATGTLFDISLVGGRTSVLLLEGSVEVRSANAAGRHSGRQHLGPGDKLVLSPAAPPVRQRVAPGETAWPAQMLAFDDTPLDEAARLANRYGQAQLRLGDERIGQLRVSGAFRAGDVAGLARSLAAAFDLRLVRQPDGDKLLDWPAAGDGVPAPRR